MGVSHRDPANREAGVEKMTPRLLGFLLLLCLTSSASAQSIDDLIIITEEYPPLNFSEDGIRRGIATDLLVEMLGASGSLKSHKDIASLPWARGYRILQHNSNILLYSMTRTAERENQFKWVGPIISSEIVLLAHRQSKIKIDDLQQIYANGYRVGVVLADVGEQLLLEQGVPKKQLFPSNKGIYLVETMNRGGFDLIAYDKLVSLWHIRSLGLSPDDFEAVYSLQSADYYFAFSRDTGDLVIETLQRELDRLKANGRLQEIIEKYLNSEVAL
jgi:ABC-type amino acid transport substrate-binding protein